MRLLRNAKQKGRSFLLHSTPTCPNQGNKVNQALVILRNPRSLEPDFTDYPDWKERCPQGRAGMLYWSKVVKRGGRICG